MPDADNLLNNAINHIHNLEIQIQFMVDYMNDRGLLEEGCFTFPNGITIHATQILEEDNAS
jgi:hypothetical protein